MTTGYPEPGAELGPFRIGRRLGVGGMGIVFQALDTQLNRQVALKIIAPHIGENAEFRARFTREAQAQASLDSPHVVQVYSFGEAEGRLYIASQLIPDGDLGQMLSKGQPPAQVAANVIAQVADGLSDAHAAGLIHRDIKPGNVLLRYRDNTLNAYLGDFGIARRQDPEHQLTQAGNTVGTPTYMAPELHTGGEAGPASDIYALGCLLWAALTGKSPFSGNTDYQVIMGHVEGPIPQLAVTGPLTQELNRVLRTALAKNPADRYASAAAMRDDLRAVGRLPDGSQPVHPDGEPTPSSGGTEPDWRFVPPKTPTPTPMPGPAPAAPPFRARTPTPHGPPATQLGQLHGYASVPQQRARRKGKIMAFATLAMLLVAGAVVLVVVLATKNGGGGGGGAEGGGESTTTSREDTARANLGKALAADATSDTEVKGGECLADYLVDQYGVDTLIDVGFLNEDLTGNAEPTNTSDPNYSTVSASLILGVGICSFQLAGSSLATPS